LEKEKKRRKTYLKRNSGQRLPKKPSIITKVKKDLCSIAPEEKKE